MAGFNAGDGWESLRRMCQLSDGYKWVILYVLVPVLNEARGNIPKLLNSLNTLSAELRNRLDVKSRSLYRMMQPG